MHGSGRCTGIAVAQETVSREECINPAFWLRLLSFIAFEMQSFLLPACIYVYMFLLPACIYIRFLLQLYGEWIWELWQWAWIYTFRGSLFGILMAMGWADYFCSDALHAICGVWMFGWGK